MNRSPAAEAILRTLAFHAAWGHTPTLPELFLSLDSGEGEAFTVGEVESAWCELVASGEAAIKEGHVGFPEDLETLLIAVHERDPLQQRKRRRARGVASWLARQDGVRFVALGNTTALGNARDQGDLDFFVIVRHGSIWSSRLLGDGPYKAFGQTPKSGGRKDAVCLSYFVSDAGLDLSRHMLPDDDPYFRHWFLALLPLYDDGVSSDLWSANALLLRRHPLAKSWIVPPDFQVRRPRLRVPASGLTERAAKGLQTRWFPARIRELMNQDTRVMVNDSVLKFHVDDGREAYRLKYRDICKTKGISP